MAQEKSLATARIVVQALYSSVRVISRAMVLKRLRMTEKVIGSLRRASVGSFLVGPAAIDLPSNGCTFRLRLSRATKFALRPRRLCSNTQGAARPVHLTL